MCVVFDTEHECEVKTSGSNTLITQIEDRCCKTVNRAVFPIRDLTALFGRQNHLFLWTQIYFSSTRARGPVWRGGNKGGQGWRLPLVTRAHKFHTKNPDCGNQIFFAMYSDVRPDLPFTSMLSVRPKPRPLPAV